MKWTFQIEMIRHEGHSLVREERTECKTGSEGESFKNDRSLPHRS